MRTLFLALLWLPIAIENWLKGTVVPFNRRTYAPSLECERRAVQHTRNAIGLADYHMKRALLGRK